MKESRDLISANTAFDKHSVGLAQTFRSAFSCLIEADSIADLKVCPSLSRMLKAPVAGQVRGRWHPDDEVTPHLASSVGHPLPKGPKGEGWDSTRANQPLPWKRENFTPRPSPV